MNEHPILFSGEMVKAILAGKKTQTRRVIKPQPEPLETVDLVNRVTVKHEGKYVVPRYSYGIPGDKLWVRESCQIYGHWVKNGHTKSEAQRWRFSIHTSKQVLYAGSFVKSPSNKTQLGFYKRPSIFMPRWASRINLGIVHIRAERLQDISDADCCAEIGCQPTWTGEGSEPYKRDLKGAFSILWDSINSKRGYPWASNPWVWVIEFAML